MRHASKIGNDKIWKRGSEDAYEFFAVAEGLRIRLDVQAECDSDAEAGLIAISLTKRLIGVEAWRHGELVYLAPARLALCH